MFSGLSAENIRKNKLCALCVFAVNISLQFQPLLPDVQSDRQIEFDDITDADAIFFKPPLVDFQGKTRRYGRGVDRSRRVGSIFWIPAIRPASSMKAMESGMRVSFIQNDSFSGFG